MTREQWLNALLERLNVIFKDADRALPEKIRVSCGWPSTGGVAPKKRRIGECWSEEQSGDKHHEIFVSPYVSDPVKVADVLVHELCHAVVGVKEKHKGEFTKCAKAVGLEGKMTATHAGDALRCKLEAIVLDMENALGKYPHATLIERLVEKAQKARMIKLECDQCGYIVRTTRVWIAKGTPTCPCGGAMPPEDTDDDED